MSTADNDNNVSICANCSKEGNDVNNICNKCNQVKYCNAACKKKHRNKHKKACERRVAELHDEKLFQDPPPKEDCPLCMQPVPYAIGLCDVGTTYMPCCGKSICEGCVVAAHGAMIEGELNALCPFCRIRLPSFDDVNRKKLKQCKQRMKLNDASAFYTLGRAYQHAGWGLPVDDEEALKWMKKAADLGHPDAHHIIANEYYEGQHGVDIDMNKAIHHWKQAAIGGHEGARLNLGSMDYNDDNIDRAMKHYMISAKSGYDQALKRVGVGYKDGHVTKDEYANTLRAYQVSVNEMKSVERDNALLVHFNN